MQGNRRGHPASLFPRKKRGAISGEGGAKLLLQVAEREREREMALTRSLAATLF